LQCSASVGNTLPKVLHLKLLRLLQAHKCLLLPLTNSEAALYVGVCSRLSAVFLALDIRVPV
jgi:hypothetical protein